MPRYENKKEILSRGMTVAELIEALQNESPTARVVLASEYGDFSRTVQALVIDSVDAVDYGDLALTAYSQSGLCISDSSRGLENGEPDLSDDEDMEQVVVLQHRAVR